MPAQEAVAAPGGGYELAALELVQSFGAVGPPQRFVADVRAQATQGRGRSHEARFRVGERGDDVAHEVVANMVVFAEPREQPAALQRATPMRATREQGDA